MQVMVYNIVKIILGGEKVSVFGDYLKELRGNRSLREMEKITGISHTYLSTLEKGYDPRSGKERKPTPETLKKLSESLNVPYEDLMRKAGYMKNSLGEHIKDLRKNKGLTLEDLSNESGLSIEYLSSLENNEQKNPSTEALYKLSILLDTPYSELLLKAGYYVTGDWFYFESLSPTEQEEYDKKVSERQEQEFAIETYRKREYPDILEFLKGRNVYYNKRKLSEENKRLAIKLLDSLFEDLEQNYPSEEQLLKEVKEAQKFANFIRNAVESDGPPNTKTNF